MTYIRIKAAPGRRLRLLVLILACLIPAAAGAQEENRLRRVQILPRAGYTRINLFFQAPPDYSLVQGSGRLRLSVKGCDAPSLRKLARYADPRIASLSVLRRYQQVELIFRLKQGDPGVEVLDGNPAVLSLLIGPPARRTPSAPEIAAGRESILAGTERFVRQFGAPARVALPFRPSDPRVLKSLLGEEDAKLFERGEGFLYREQGREAQELFSPLLAKATAARALVCYRLGEALALQGRDRDALALFRQAEPLQPGYLDREPEVLQVYAELRVKTGDYPGARALFGRLMTQLSGTPFAAQLSNRLAYLWECQGESELALGMYRTVLSHAPGTEAATRADMRLADREMFSVPRKSYRALYDRYDAIYRSPGDLALRDEAFFKMALLQALYGPADEALAAAIDYGQRYPRGIFSTIVKKMREDLLLPVYGELYAARDGAALLKLAQDNREYLARCLLDPRFAPRLADAYREAGQLTKELELFGYLAERSYSAAAAPFLTSRLTEDALALGDLARAESAGRSFLARFPKDPRADRVREELGRIAFQKGELKTAAAQLSFLNVRGKGPQFPESYYYLGKALAAAGDQRGAELSLTRFAAMAPQGSHLLADGYLALAGARSALKEYPAALAAYREGAKVAGGESAQQCLYKLGELYLQLNQVRQAREAWEQVAGRGAGGTWGKLASQALDDLKWRLKISGELP